MPTDADRVQAVFLAAAEIADPPARAAYLDGACGDDPGLRARVDALLRALAQPDSLLDRPAVAPPSPDAPTAGFDADPAADDELPLGFLAPAARPDGLGRIGHYEVLEVLGRGGFGIVFRAFDDVLQRVVAVKVLDPRMAATSPARKRFLREARSSARVRHENVVQVYEVGEQPLPYIAMEFIPGETLQRRLDRTGPVDPAEVVRVGRQVAEGLAAAHATGLIHRDIKPGNVLLEGGHLRVKITDFGLARAADDASLTRSGVIAGTPMYMAPEQAQGRPLDQRADLFSLGSVLYQMAAGRPPFRAATTLAVMKRVAEDAPRPIREVIPETPPWLCDVIAKLHAKDPADRFPSARAAADVLADCEAQLAAHGRVRDTSGIPRSAPATEWAKLLDRGNPSGWLRRRWVPAVAVLVFFVAWASGTIVREEWKHSARTPRTVDEAVRVPDPPPAAGGWVDLFNGKDLSGWKTHPDQPGRWVVRDGVLVGNMAQSHLFTDRGDYANFRLRAEVKLNRGGDSGVRFRAPFALQRGKKAWQVLPAGGYEAEFNDNPGAPVGTGSVWRVSPPEPPVVLARADGDLARPDEWQTLEVTAVGGRVTVAVDGRVAADCADPLAQHAAGHVALQCFGPQTVVQFRRIEVQELPADEGWVRLFDGKGTGGWLRSPQPAGDWTAKDGVLEARTPFRDYLFTERGDYRNFHLRAEVKVNRGGDGGLLFRCERGLGSKFGTPRGYESEVSDTPAVPRGSLWLGPEGPDNSVPAKPGPDRSDKWFVQEVIATGGRVVVKIDGEVVLDHTADPERYARGHIALQVWGEQTALSVRKVEMMELPSPP